jgi:hypothetical protein
MRSTPELPSGYQPVRLPCVGQGSGQLDTHSGKPAVYPRRGLLQ